MNPNLVPTVIVNKNGVTTTVHKKPQSASVSSSAIPAPSSTLTDTVTTHRDEIITQIREWLEIESYRRSPEIQSRLPDAISELLLTYSDNAVTAMHEYLTTDLNDSDAERNRELLLQLLGSSRRNVASPSTVHEYLNFLPALQHNNHNPELAMAIISALHTYKQLPVMENYAEADETTKQQVSALINVTSDLIIKFDKREIMMVSAAWTSGSFAPPRHYDPMGFDLPLENGDEPRLLGDDLISIIIEKPEEAEEITRIIIKDRITDGELIRDRITSKAPSLREGII
jgi:hypothetical protein